MKIKSLLKNVLLIVIFLLFLFFYPKLQRLRIDKAGATKTLILSGYVPLSVGGRNGYRYFNGGSFDFYSTEFKAINPSKDTVSGVVTEGLFVKGSTIRLD